MRRWRSVKKNLPQTMTSASAAAIGVVSRLPGSTVGLFAEDTHAGIAQALARFLFVVLACAIIPLAAHAADDTPLTKEQIKQFLQTAEIIKSKPSSKGVTHPWQLTLSNALSLTTPLSNR